MSQAEALERRIQELEARVSQLALDNQALAERQLDATLLGQLSDQLDAETEPGPVIERGLERIAMLLDLPVCLAGALSPEGLCITEAHLARADRAPPGLVLHLGDEVRAALTDGPVLLEGPDLARLGPLPGPLATPPPAAALLLPARTRLRPTGVLAFLDPAAPGRLRSAAPLLLRAAEAIVGRVENRALLMELLELNQSLEERVAIRTAALRASEERFRTAFTTSPDSININRLEDGVYLAINQGFTRLTGWSEEEVLGRSSLELGIWADAADRERLVAGLGAEGFVENLEASFRFKDGRVARGLMSARLLQLDGRACILSVTRDVTALRKAEAERSQLADQLRQSQKLEAIGRLAGGVAHDFNNLLTVIMGCASTLRGELVPAQVQAAADVEQIEQAGRRAADLTRRLLAFARKRPTAASVLDLNQVVRTSEALLARLLGEDVSLEIALEPEPWGVLGDAGQLEQVIVNLAVNARDAMPEGGRLRISTANEPAGGPGAAAGGQAAAADLVRLSVEDDGIGMSPEVQARLFEPFFTTKPVGKGTGLGLATVYGIVTQWGGSIQVESQPGSGSRFVVRFPRTARVQAVAAQQPARVDVRGEERVLLVEDDAAVRRVSERALREAGYRLQVAASGADALAQLDALPGRVDLVVTDLIMPGMGGRALAEAIRRRHPGTRILMVSGYAPDVQDAKGALAGGFELLEKPFTPLELLARVRRLLDA